MAVVKTNQQRQWLTFLLLFLLFTITIVVKLRDQLDKKATKLDRFIPGYHVVVNEFRYSNCDFSEDADMCECHKMSENNEKLVKIVMTGPLYDSDHNFGMVHISPFVKRAFCHCANPELKTYADESTAQIYCLKNEFYPPSEKGKMQGFMSAISSLNFRIDSSIPNRPSFQLRSLELYQKITNTMAEYIMFQPTLYEYYQTYENLLPMSAYALNVSSPVIAKKHNEKDIYSFNQKAAQLGSLQYWQNQTASNDFVFYRCPNSVTYSALQGVCICRYEYEPVHDLGEVNCANRISNNGIDNGYVRCFKKLGPYCSNPQLLDESKAGNFELNNPLISVHSLYKDTAFARGRAMLNTRFLLASYSLVRFEISPILISPDHKSRCFTPLLRFLNKIHSEGSFATGHSTGWGQNAILEDDVLAIEDENGNLYKVIYRPLHKGNYQKLGWITGRMDGYQFHLMKWSEDYSVSPPASNGYYVPNKWVIEACRKGVAIDSSSEPVLISSPQANHHWLGAGYTMDDIMRIEEEEKSTNFMLMYSVYQTSHIGKLFVGALPGLETFHKLNYSDLNDAVRTKEAINYIMAYDETQSVVSLIQKEIRGMCIYFYYASPQFDTYRQQELFPPLSEYEAFRKYLHGDSALRQTVYQDKDGFFQELTHLYIARTILQLVLQIPKKLNTVYDSSWEPISDKCPMVFFYNFGNMTSKLDEPLEYLRNGQCKDIYADNRLNKWQFLETGGAPPLVDSPLITGINGYKYMGTGIDIGFFNTQAAKLRRGLNRKLNGKDLSEERRETYDKVTKLIISKSFPAVTEFTSSSRNGYLLGEFLKSSSFTELAYEYLVNQPSKMFMRNVRFLKEVTDLFVQSIPFPVSAAKKEHFRKILVANFTNSLGRPGKDDIIGNYNMTALSIFSGKYGIKASPGIKNFVHTLFEVSSARQTAGFFESVFLNNTDEFRESSNKALLDEIILLTVKEFAAQVDSMTIFRDYNLTNIMISSTSTFEKSVAYLYSLFGANAGEFENGIREWITKVKSKCSLKSSGDSLACSKSTMAFLEELNTHIGGQISAAISYSRRRRRSFQVGVGLHGAVLNNIYAPPVLVILAAIKQAYTFSLLQSEIPNSYWLLVQTKQALLDCAENARQLFSNFFVAERMLTMSSLKFVGKSSIGSGVMYYDEFRKGTFHVRGERLTKEFYFNNEGMLEGPGVKKGTNEILGILETKEQVSKKLIASFYPHMFQKGDRVMVSSEYLSKLLERESQNKLWRLYPGPIQKEALYEEIFRLCECFQVSLSPINKITFLKKSPQQGLEEFENAILKSEGTFESDLRSRPMLRNEIEKDKITDWKSKFTFRSPVDQSMKTRNDVVRDFFYGMVDLAKKYGTLAKTYGSKELLVEQLSMDFLFLDFLRTFDETIDFYGDPQKAEARIAALNMEAFSVASKLGSSAGFPSKYTYAAQSSIIKEISKLMSDFSKDYIALISESQSRYTLQDRVSTWSAVFQNNLNRFLFKDELVDNIQDIIIGCMGSQLWRMKHMERLLASMSTLSFVKPESTTGVMVTGFEFRHGRPIEEDLYIDKTNIEVGYFASVEVEFREWGRLRFRIPHSDIKGKPYLKRLGVRKSIGVFRKFRIAEIVVKPPPNEPLFDIDSYMPLQSHPPTMYPESLQMVFFENAVRTDDIMMLSTFMNSVNSVQNSVYFVKAFPTKAMSTTGTAFISTCTESSLTLEQCAFKLFFDDQPLGLFQFQNIRDVSLYYYLRLHNPVDINEQRDMRYIFSSDSAVMDGLSQSNAGLQSFSTASKNLEHLELDKLRFAYFTPLYSSNSLPLTFYSYFWQNKQMTDDTITIPSNPAQRVNNTNEIVKIVNLMFTANSIFATPLFRMVHFKSTSNYLPPLSTKGQ
eukprot:Nk52_evm44s2209 gene=Nk52_evmTU44s2209